MGVPQLDSSKTRTAGREINGILKIFFASIYDRDSCLITYWYISSRLVLFLVAWIRCNGIDYFVV